MNYPVASTPNPAIHQAPNSSRNQLAFTEQYLEALGQQLLRGIIQWVVQAIVGAIPGGQKLEPLLDSLHTWANGVEGAAGDIETLIQDVLGGAGTAADLAALINLIKAVVNTVESLFGSSFPKTFPSTFGTSTSGTLADLVPKSQWQQLLDGITSLVTPGATDSTVVTALGALQQLRHTIHSDISQDIQDGAAGVQGAGSAITQTLQEFPGVNVTGIGAGGGVGTTIVDDIHGLVDGGIGALNPSLSGATGATVADWEAALSAHLTGLFNGLTGSSVTKAGAADVSAAAVSIAEQLASQSKQAANIAAQLPQFYGGSGAAGVGIEVEFSGGVPQGAGNAFTAISSTQSQYSGTNGYNSTAAAQTDSETVSGLWSTIIPANTWRGVYLRANTAGTTKVWAQWQVVGDPGAQANGAYYIPNDTSAYFQLQIGCDVAGISTVLKTFGPFPLWQSAGDVIVVSYTLVVYGPWWNKNEYWSPNYGPGWSALEGYSLYLNSGNNAVSLEAVADTFALDYPGVGQLSVIDTAPISLMGSAYRQAGFTDAAGVPGDQTSWAFWDSGPTAGPQREPLATLDSTAAMTWGDLSSTIGPEVTVNVGASGMVEVTVSCICANNTTGGTAYMGWAASGANTIAAGSDGLGGNQNVVVAGTGGGGGSGKTLLTGLLPGPTTFTAKYQVGATGLAGFLNRDISALPL